MSAAVILDGPVCLCGVVILDEECTAMGMERSLVLTLALLVLALFHWPREPNRVTCGDSGGEDKDGGGEDISGRWGCIIVGKGNPAEESNLSNKPGEFL